MISPPFRERLMLAVTSVNKCRYCSYAHTRRALMEGIPHDEIRELDGGTFRRSPADELPALLYAQHWSENSGVPEPEARAKLIETYGLEKTQAIELSLRLIQMGNLMGNTFDLFLNRISFGRWGLTDEEGGIRLADESDV
jgi:AhpD family alkylhydroperoxidase